MLKFAPIKQTATQDLSAASLSFTYTMLHDGFFHWMGIAFDGATTETIVVNFNSASGAAFDLVLESTNLVGGTTHVFRPNTPILLSVGDAITITVTDANNVNTASLTAFFEEFETVVL